MNLRTHKALTAAGLVTVGVLAGAALGVTGIASADDTITQTPAAAPADRPQETPLTGETLEKVKAAVLAKYPGATFDRVETDGDGVYEAHIPTQDGTPVTVELDKAYAITGVVLGRGGPGGRGGQGPRGPRPADLTGDSLAKVKAAVVAKYPGATVEHAHARPNGGFVALTRTKAGEHLLVALDKDYTVTGTLAPRERRGGPGGFRGGPELTGDALAKVKAAIEAKYPGATVFGAHTEPDGSYDAHITTKAGERLAVQLDKSFTITGTRTGPGQRG
jgi:hypothetical protein